MAETTQLHLTGGDLIDARRVAVIALIAATHGLNPECQRTAAEITDAFERIGLYGGLIDRLGEPVVARSPGLPRPPARGAARGPRAGGPGGERLRGRPNRGPPEPRRL